MSSILANRNNAAATAGQYVFRINVMCVLLLLFVFAIIPKSINGMLLFWYGLIYDLFFFSLSLNFSITDDNLLFNYKPNIIIVLVVVVVVVKDILLDLFAYTYVGMYACVM